MLDGESRRFSHVVFLFTERVDNKVPATARWQKDWGFVRGGRTPDPPSPTHGPEPEGLTDPRGLVDGREWVGDASWTTLPPLHPYKRQFLCWFWHRCSHGKLVRITFSHILIKYITKLLICITSIVITLNVQFHIDALKLKALNCFTVVIIDCLSAIHSWYISIARKDNATIIWSILFIAYSKSLIVNNIVTLWLSALTWTHMQPNNRITAWFTQVIIKS